MEKQKMQCSGCKDTFNREDIRLVEKTPYCDDCIGEHTAKCSSCGLVYKKENLTNVPNQGDKLFCPYCYNQKFFTCNICDHVLPMSKLNRIAQDGTKYCETCSIAIIKCFLGDSTIDVVPENEMLASLLSEKEPD